MHIPLDSQLSRSHSSTSTGWRGAVARASSCRSSLVIVPRRSKAGGHDGPDASELSPSRIHDAMRNGAIEANAVASPEPMDRIGQVDLGYALQHEPALLGGIRERLGSGRGARRVDAQDELDLPRQIWREEVIRDAVTRRETLSLRRSHDDAPRRPRRREQASDGDAERFGQRFQRAERRIEMIPLELAQRTGRDPGLGSRLAEREVVPQTSRADARAQPDRR